MKDGIMKEQQTNNLLGLYFPEVMSGNLPTETVVKSRAILSRAGIQCNGFSLDN